MCPGVPERKEEFTVRYSEMSAEEIVEGIFNPIAPAGALWCTAEDMSKFLIMLLNQGVLSNGARVFSAENLEELLFNKLNPFRIIKKRLKKIFKKE